MNYVYAALLLHSAGKEINEENLKKVVSAAGEGVEESKVKALVAALEGVNITDVINKAVTMPVAVAAVPVTQAPAAEQKKEGPSEAELEKKAEEAAEGLSSLFM